MTAPPAAAVAEDANDGFKAGAVVSEGSAALGVFGSGREERPKLFPETVMEFSFEAQVGHGWQSLVINLELVFGIIMSDKCLD